MINQNIPSVAQVRVNFMDSVKKADKIIEVQSKAYNKLQKDGRISVVAEVIDGVRLMMAFDDAPEEDMSAELKGCTVNVRFTKEQWKAVNARFHEMDAIGALIEVEVDGPVSYGTLTVRGEETESYTIYAGDVNDIEPVVMSRVGIRDKKSAVLERMRAHKANNSERRRANSRGAQAAAAKAGTEQLAINFG